MKNNKDILPNQNKVYKFSRTLNINKNRNLKYKSKSNKKLDMKTTKPIKIKNLKSKYNSQQTKYNSLNKNENKEKEIDTLFEDYIYKDIIKPVKSNKNIHKDNNKILEKNNYIKINNKTSNRIIKKIKNQLISNDIYNTTNIRNYNQLINGGNDKNTHGKLNLNITLNNKSPIRLRKINNQKKFTYGGANYYSTNKKGKQMNTIYVNNRQNLNMDLNLHTFNNDLSILNNEESTILNLEEEIENLKRENLYQEMVINDMKKQLDDIRKDKDKKKSNGNLAENINDIQLLRQEMDILNDKIYHDFINNDLLNNIDIEENINKEEANLFDKLKINYLNNKKLMNDLKIENEQIKSKLNNKNTINGNTNNSNIYLNEKQKCISLFYKQSENKNQSDDNNYLLDDINFINDYLKYNLKELNKYYETNKDENNLTNYNNVKLMIKMTLNSNLISEDEIISLFINNLLNYTNTIEIFISKYLKTNNSSDKEMIHSFFKNILIGDKNEININNIYEEIKSFFEENIKNLKDILIKDYFSMKTNKLVQILKDCKNIDSESTGLIELNQFKKILNKYNFFKEFSEDENKIYNILIYNMKKNINFEQIGLFDLIYINLFDELGLNESILKDNSSENNSIAFEKSEHEKKYSLFSKSSEKKEGQQKIIKEKKIQRKIISNVDFKSKNDTKEKERGSGNSNNTYGLLSSNKYSFDYSSKSGSKEACSLKEGIKEVTSNFMKSEEYLLTFCKEYVDNIFKICLKDIKRQTITFYRDYIIEDNH